MIVDDEIDCGGYGWEEDDLVLGNLLNHLDDDNNANSAPTNNDDDDFLVPRLQPPPTPSFPPSSFDRTIGSNKDDDYNDDGGGDDIGGGGWDDDLNFTLDDNDDDVNNSENNDNGTVNIAAAVAAVNNPTAGDGDYSGGGTGRWPFNDTSLMNALDVTTATTIIDNDNSYEDKHEEDDGAPMNVMEETVENNDDNWDFDDDEIDFTFNNNNENDTKNDNIIDIKSEEPMTMATIMDRIPHKQPQQQHYNVPPHQSMAHNDNARHVADNYHGKDDNSNNNNRPPINSNHEVGERGWDFDGEEDDTDVLNDKNNDDIIEMEDTVAAVIHPSTLTQHLSRPNPPPPPPPPRPALSPPMAHRTHSANNSNTQPPLPINSNNNTNNPVEERIYNMLSSYMESIHDNKLYTRIHTKLNNLLHSSGSSGGDVSTASELCTYYATRPGLRKYTLGVELDRMDYQLIVPATNNNKGCVSITSKEKIRQFFNVDIHGEKLDNTSIDDDVGVVSTVELLLRSANQSLLADMLVALTCPEEMMDGVDDERNIKMRSSNDGLILSGPTLCMTSVAEKCCFKIDLLSGVVETICLLAISIPYNHHNADVDVITNNDNADGRLILARAEVSVRFRPVGIDNENEECTVQYAVRSVIPYYAPDSDMIRCAALALAQEEQYTHSFVNSEYNSNNRQGDEGNQCVIATDARDQFLLSHQLVDSGLLVVSDHLDRLRGAAHAKTTGFRSALRQLDGVTNVSSKLHDLGRFGASLGLVLPSVEEINAAEREAMEEQHSLPPSVSSALKFPRPADMPAASTHFPRLMDTGSIQTKVPPPPPPPPPPPMSSNKPRPLIGGLLMSGLSRLAAVATLPDESRSENDWEEGATTASSTRPTPSSLFSGNNVSCAYHHVVHTTKEAYHVAAEEDEQNTALVHKGLDTNHGVVDDAGWSDDEFVFDDTGDDNEQVEKIYVTDDVQLNVAKIDECTTTIHNTSNEHHDPIPRRHPTLQSTMIPPRTTKPPPPPPLTPPSQQEQTNYDNNNKACNSPRTFEDEFVLVLREKQESEIHEMKVSGMMKRWRPISEDPVLRNRLLKVMVAQIQRS
jgi:hypothetical protein